MVKICNTVIPFGLKFEDEDVQKIIRKLEPFDQVDFHWGRSLRSYKIGFSLNFDRVGKLISVHVYNSVKEPSFLAKVFGQKPRKYSCYNGDLPFKFSITDTRREVEFKIGLPTKTSSWGNGVVYDVQMSRETRMGMLIMYKSSQVRHAESIDKIVIYEGHNMTYMDESIRLDCG